MILNQELINCFKMVGVSKLLPVEWLRIDSSLTKLIRGKNLFVKFAITN